jgi:hypothetical protein
MSLSDLASFAGVISGLAVLVSLIYLNLQTRQNAKHTQALIQQGRAAQATTYALTWATNPALTELYLRGSTGDPGLTDLETTQFVLLTHSHFSIWEDMYYQHQAKLIDPERHAGMVESIRRQLQTPGYRASWEWQRDQFGKNFRSLLDDLTQKGRAKIQEESVPVSSEWQQRIGEEMKRKAL